MVRRTMSPSATMCAISFLPSCPHTTSWPKIIGTVPVRYFSLVPKAITLPMKSPGDATSMSMIGSSNRTSADVAPLRMAVLAAISKPTALESISW